MKAIYRLPLCTFALIALIGAAPQPSPSNSLFGMEIGKSLDFPVCIKNATDVICQENYGKNPEIPWDTFTVRYPYGTSPEIVAGLSVTVRVFDGKVVGFVFETMGLGSQENDLNLLSKKYGKPTLVHYEDVENLAGGKFRALLAKWEFSDLSVKLDSVALDARTGHVTVLSSQGQILQREFEDRERKRRVQM